MPLARHWKRFALLAVKNFQIMSKLQELKMSIQDKRKPYNGVCRLRDDLFISGTEIVHKLKQQPELIVNDYSLYYCKWIGSNFFISKNCEFWYSAESIDFDFPSL